VKVNGYKCDVCGKPREQANHWFLIKWGRRALILKPWDGATQEAIIAADQHVCGAGCLSKVVSGFAEGKKLA
jgi:hypothetical protein